MVERIPTPENIEHLLRDSGPLTLRALCRALWPGVSWQTAVRVSRAWPGEVQAPRADWLAAQLRALVEHHAVQVLPPPGGVNGAPRRFALTATPWTPVLGPPTAVHGRVINAARLYRLRWCFAVPQTLLPLLTLGLAVEVSVGLHQLAAIIEDVEVRPGADGHCLAVVRADLSDRLGPLAG